MTQDEIEDSKAVADLKRAMLSGDANAETFEKAIKHEGLTVQMICLIHAYYASDYQKEMQKALEDFEDAIAFKAQREAEVEE